MNVLVVAAHPDDEVLGCGGTIAKHVQQGDKVHVLIMAEGLTSRNLARTRNSFRAELGNLQAMSRRANDILGVADLCFRDFPDNRMDSVPLLNVIKVVEDAVARCRPQVVYTHYRKDLNIDHRITCDAVVTACRPVHGQTTRTLLFFEIPSSTEWQFGGESFSPNWFVDVADTLGKKTTALEAYADEMRPWPHPRSLAAIEHLARWRGAAAGVNAAEAFVLGMHIRNGRLNDEMPLL